MIREQKSTDENAGPSPWPLRLANLIIRKKFIGARYRESDTKHTLSMGAVDGTYGRTNERTPV
jgi:hypothetical protein